MNTFLSRILSIERLVSIFLILSSIAVLFFLNLEKGESGNPLIIPAFINTLAYYTVQTNLMVLVWNLTSLKRWRRNIPRGNRDAVFRWACIVYITITCLVYHTLLRPFWNPGGIMLPVNRILHYAIPFLFITDWIISEKPGIIRLRFLPLLLVYPFIYLAGALAFGALTEQHVYPFINLEELCAGRFIMNCLALAGGFLLLGVLYYGIDRLKGRAEWNVAL